MGVTRAVHVSVLSLVAVFSLALAQPTLGERASGAASAFYFIANDGETEIPIAHFADVAQTDLPGGRLRGLGLHLPSASAGPVEFYVNGKLIATDASPPFVLVHADLLQPGTWHVFAVPDVGYPAEVTYSIW